VRPLAPAPQRLDAIARQSRKINQGGCAVQDLQAALSLRPELRKAPDPSSVKQSFCILVPEASDHYKILAVLRVTYNVTQRQLRRDQTPVRRYLAPTRHREALHFALGKLRDAAISSRLLRQTTPRNDSRIGFGLKALIVVCLAWGRFR
jgi:hypothetical protein